MAEHLCRLPPPSTYLHLPPPAPSMNLFAKNPFRCLETTPRGWPSIRAGQVTFNEHLPRSGILSHQILTTALAAWCLFQPHFPRMKSKHRDVTLLTEGHPATSRRALISRVLVLNNPTTPSCPNPLPCPALPKTHTFTAILFSHISEKCSLTVYPVGRCRPASAHLSVGPHLRDPLTPAPPAQPSRWPTPAPGHAPRKHGRMKLTPKGCR